MNPTTAVLEERVAAHVLDLVRPALAERVLGHLGADGDPVDPRGELEAAVGLDRQLVAGRVEGVGRSPYSGLR